MFPGGLRIKSNILQCQNVEEERNAQCTVIHLVEFKVAYLFLLLSSFFFHNALFNSPKRRKVCFMSLFMHLFIYSLQADSAGLVNNIAGVQAKTPLRSPGK